MIPKILHFVWLQGFDAMPEQYMRCVESWKALHPDWDVMEWTADNLPVMLNSWILERTKDPTFLSEIIRFEVVSAFGGVYVDADMECRKPINQLVEHLQAFVSKRNILYLETCGFGCKKEHPWIRAVLKGIDEYKGRIRRILDILVPLERVTFGRDDVKIFPVHMFHYSDEEVKNHSSPDVTYAVHHRYGTWWERRNKVALAAGSGG
jgi:hypothetical protein